MKKTANKANAGRQGAQNEQQSGSKAKNCGKQQPKNCD